jgi:hypothetical protein
MVGGSGDGVVQVVNVAIDEWQIDMK